MSRTFAYARGSTTGQSGENQLGEIEAAGFSMEMHRIITETISESVAARERPRFARLLDRIEPGGAIVVTKLDRLGRDAIDVAETIKALAAIPVRVHCLALQGVDLTGSTGSFTLQVLNAVAQFARDLLIERTQAGLARARSQGKRIGSPPAVSPETAQRSLWRWMYASPSRRPPDLLDQPRDRCECARSRDGQFPSGLIRGIPYDGNHPPA